MILQPDLIAPKKLRLRRLGLLIIGMILLLDGAILLWDKKIHLGTLLPFAVGAIFCIYALYYQRIYRFLSTQPKLYRLWRIGWRIFMVWLISLLAFFLYLQHKIDAPVSDQTVDAIIILGSGVIQGQPSPTLAARLDRAAELAHQQGTTLIIVTGGLDYAEKHTEAEVMAKYLEQTHAIPASSIQLEDQSTSTELNLRNSQPILAQQHIKLSDPIAIVTSDFHTLRAAAIAKKQGYTQISTFAAETPLYTRYNAWLREYFAYLSGWILREY